MLTLDNKTFLLQKYLLIHASYQMRPFYMYLTNLMRLSLLMLCVGLGAGCSKEKVVVEGTREDIINLQSHLRAEVPEDIATFIHPKTYNKRSWASPHGATDGSRNAYAYGNKLTKKWSLSIGSGSSRYQRLIATPLFVDGNVIALDARGTLSSFDLKTQRRNWSQSTNPKGTSSSDALGGGICFGDGKIFATSGFGKTSAYDVKTGKHLWTTQGNSPIRTAPMHYKGKVFIINVESHLDVLSAEKGDLLWSHTGVSESAGILGGATPIVSKDNVIVPYPSGEVFSLQLETGQPNWTDNVASSLNLTSLGTISHVHAQPVVDGDVALVSSHSGLLAAVDVNTGVRKWFRETTVIHTPTMTSRYAFILNDMSQVACLRKSDGKVIWVHDLPAHVNKKPDHKIFWSGPLLGDGFVYLVSSEGDLVSLTSSNGKKSKTIKLPTGAKLIPQIVNNTLYVLCDDGRLVAYE